MTTTATTPEGSGRLRLTLYAAWQVALFVPCLLAFVFVVLGGVLSPVVVGLGLLLLAVPSCRWLADQHRAIAGRVLGTPVPSSYRPPPGGGPVPRVVAWARDPMTWRDLAWLLASATVGLALSLLVVLLLLLVVTGALWWFGADPIMRARCAMDRWFLSYGHTEVLEQRVQVLTETRAEAVDHSATELRRIERDLHDGARRVWSRSRSSSAWPRACWTPIPRRRTDCSPRRAAAAAPRSASSGPWCGASTRRCSPTVGSAAPSRPWHSTWRFPWTCG